MKQHVKEEYEQARGTFEDAPEENKDFLKLCSFICFLSFDVYMKKMMIQKLIDEIKTGESQKEETKDTK